MPHKLTDSPEEREIIARWYRPNQPGYTIADLVARLAGLSRQDPMLYRVRSVSGLRNHINRYRGDYEPHFAMPPGEIAPREACGRWYPDAGPFVAPSGQKTSRPETIIDPPEVEPPPVDLSFCVVDSVEYDAEADVYTVAAKSAPGGRLRLPGDTHREVLQRYSAAKGHSSTLNEIARWLGLRRPWVRDYLASCDMTHDREPWTREQLATASSDELVHDVLEQRRGVEAARLERAKLAQDQRDAAAYRDLRASVVDPLCEWIRDHATGYQPPRIDARPASRPWTLVCALTDIHHGMTADPAVSPQRWDMEHSRAALLAHVEHLVGEALRRGAPERVVLGMRSDWFHCDTVGGTTAKGTRLDVDGSPLAVVRDGMLLSVQAVDAFRALGCPVDVVGMGGPNHDPMISALQLSHLEAWYWRDMDVTVSTDLHPRTYVEIGRSLYGFGHGEERDADLPELMATEAPQAWARCPHRVFIVGHLHHERTTRSRIEGHGLRGVTVYRMGTIVPPDAWHHGRGYDAPRYLSGHVVDHERGLSVAILSQAGDCRI